MMMKKILYSEFVNYASCVWQGHYFSQSGVLTANERFKALARKTVLNMINDRIMSKLLNAEEYLSELLEESKSYLDGSQARQFTDFKVRANLILVNTIDFINKIESGSGYRFDRTQIPYRVSFSAHKYEISDTIDLLLMPERSSDYSITRNPLFVQFTFTKNSGKSLLTTDMYRLAFTEIYRQKEFPNAEVRLMSLINGKKVEYSKYPVLHENIIDSVNFVLASIQKPRRNIGANCHICPYQTVCEEEAVVASIKNSRSKL
jgi:hypothetical protein